MIITWMSNTKEVHSKPRLHASLIWSMAAMLRDSFVVVLRTRPRAIPLAMTTMRKSTQGFPFLSHIWVAYGAPLGGPSGRRISAITFSSVQMFLLLCFLYMVIIETQNRRLNNIQKTSPQSYKTQIKILLFPGLATLFGWPKSIY